MSAGEMAGVEVAELELAAGGAFEVIPPFTRLLSALPSSVRRRKSERRQAATAAAEGRPSAAAIRARNRRQAAAKARTP
jgi:hypothetical protein